MELFLSLNFHDIIGLNGSRLNSLVPEQCFEEAKEISFASAGYVVPETLILWPGSLTSGWLQSEKC